MPKKPVKKQEDVDIIEIEEYPENGDDSEEEDEIPVKKTTKKKPKAKKQVEVESESESESEEEDELAQAPQKKTNSKKSSKKIALPSIILQAPEKVKKPLTEKRAAALARGREKQKAIREQRKNESLEKMKKELWEDFQKQGSSAAPLAKPKDVKEQKEKEPVTDPLEHIKKMKESLPKQDDRKHDASGLFGPVQIRSFRK
jgi:hypothetical protein